MGGILRNFLDVYNIHGQRSSKLRNQCNSEKVKNEFSEIPNKMTQQRYVVDNDDDPLTESDDDNNANIPSNL